jgi:hypothetical protein
MTTDQLENLDRMTTTCPPLPDSEIGGKVKISLADMDLPSWEHELKVDLKSSMPCWPRWTRSRRRTTPSCSTSSALLGKIASPINPGNKKVLIFTAFADTADYLYANLAPELLARRPCTAPRSPARVRRSPRSRRATTSRSC